jgi:hypothetical protein
VKLVSRVNSRRKGSILQMTGLSICTEFSSDRAAVMETIMAKQVTTEAYIATPCELLEARSQGTTTEVVAVSPIGELL